MEFKTLNKATREAMSQYKYGCESKKYCISFYINKLEKDERCGLTKTVYGTIEHFSPSEQTAIKDKNGDLWLIESKLIATMRPMTEIELKREEGENKPTIYSDKLR